MKYKFFIILINGIAIRFNIVLNNLVYKNIFLKNTF